MVRVRINSIEKDLLFKIFKSKFTNYKFIDDYIILSCEYLNEVIELIGDYLIKYGMDKKYNLTSLGVVIENLQKAWRTCVGKRSFCNGACVVSFAKWYVSRRTGKYFGRVFAEI